jgi:hypothetical protein
MVSVAAQASDRATLEDLSDTEKLSLIDMLPMRAPLEQALALCPRLEKRGPKYDEHYEAETSLFGHPATLWCDFRAGCLFQIVFDLRSVPAATVDEVFRSAVAQFSARYGATEAVEVDDPEGNAVTASWCTSGYGLDVSAGRDDPAGVMIVYQFWCAENPASVQFWQHEWSCETPSN